MKPLLCLLVAAMLCGCAAITPPPKWNPSTAATEAEYQPYLVQGTAVISGQAFLTQRGGGVVKAAGKSVTLDPATSIGNEWWEKAGRVWIQRGQFPPSSNFYKARRETVADAEGRFKFSDLPAGKYILRTEVTWEVGDLPIQGGVVGTTCEVKAGKNAEVVMAQMP